MKQVKSVTKWSGFPALVLFVFSVLLNAILNEGLTTSFFKSFIASNAGAICLAIGVSSTILVAGTDLSLGSIVSLVNVSILTFTEAGYSLVTSSIMGLAIAVICGLINGILVGVMRVNALLTTFATSTAYAGIALWILPYPGGSIDFKYGDWYSGNILGFIPTPIFLILILVILWTIISKIPIGMKVYALGNDEQKAYASGINVTFIKVFMHVFAGLCAGVGGIAMTANICAGNPLLGNTMSMNSIAAAVIGGVSLIGGIGSIWGAIFGASFLSVLTSIVVALNLSSYLQSFVQALILFTGVSISVLASNKELKDVIKNKFIKGSNYENNKA